MTLLVSLSFALATANGGQFEDLDALDGRIAQLAPALPLDRRLQLARCPEPAEISPTGGRGFAVVCPSIGWRIFVPFKEAGRPTTRTVDIRRGDLVSLDIPGDGFVVSTVATALDDAKQGQTVRLRTARDTPVLNAQATGAGQAKLSVKENP